MKDNRRIFRIFGYAAVLLVCSAPKHIYPKSVIRK